MASYLNAKTYIAALPIGTPNYVAGGFLQDWSQQILAQTPVQDMNAPNSERKRESTLAVPAIHEPEALHAFENPSAKRIRHMPAVYHEEQILTG